MNRIQIKKSHPGKVLPAALLIIFLFTQETAYLQTDSNNLYMKFENELMENLENKIENSDEEADYTEELGEMILSGNAKIQLNNLSPEVAINILKLSEYQYYQLQLYIEKYGSLLTINELAAIDGFTSDDVNRLAPYIDMKAAGSEKPKSFADFFRNPRNELLLRYGLIFEKSAGYDTTNENHYLGAPFRLCFRYKFTAGRNFSFSFAGEKDAGEELFSGTQKQGFDHYAFNISLKNIRIIKSLVVGNYKLNFGQGVVIGSGLMSGKGSGAGGIRKFATGIQPCASMNEDGSFRGIATTLGNSKISGTLFYSSQSYDGLITEGSENNDIFFEGSLSFNGYHRTIKEVAKKKCHEKPDLRNRHHPEKKNFQNRHQSDQNRL